MNNKDVSPDALQIQITNIKESQDRIELSTGKSFDELKISTNKSFEDIKAMILESRKDNTAQNLATNARVDISFNNHEISKDDRRDLHRLIDAVSVNVKVVEKDIQDIKTDLKVNTTNKIEMRGLRKGLSTFANTVSDIAKTILGLATISAIIVLAIKFFSTLQP